MGEGGPIGAPLLIELLFVFLLLILLPVPNAARLLKVQYAPDAKLRLCFLFVEGRNIVEIEDFGGDNDGTFDEFAAVGGLLFPP